MGLRRVLVVAAWVAVLLTGAAGFAAPARAEVLPDVRAAVPSDAPLAAAPTLRRAQCLCATGRVWGERWCRRSRWEVSLEAGATLFPSPDGLVGPASGNAAQFRWGALDYAPAAAFRVGAQYTRSARDRFFLRVAWNGSTSDQVSATGVIGMSTTPGAPVGATAANTATFRSEGESQTYELGPVAAGPDVRSWRVDYGGALRVFHFHEPVRVTNWAMPFPALGTLPQLRSLGHNLFFGLQPGVRVERRLSQRLRFFASAKVLAGGMLQELEVSDTAVFSAGTHSANQDRFVFAWGADVEVGLRWRLNRCWSLTAAYDVFFFDSAVRGFDAFDFSRSATGVVQSRFQESTLLLQTLYIGAVYRL